jgi:hypothetical protein
MIYLLFWWAGHTAREDPMFAADFYFEMTDAGRAGTEALLAEMKHAGCDALRGGAFSVRCYGITTVEAGNKWGARAAELATLRSFRVRDQELCS